MAAFIPGASPPEVRTAICFGLTAIMEWRNYKLNF